MPLPRVLRLRSAAALGLLAAGYTVGFALGRKPPYRWLRIKPVGLTPQALALATPALLRPSTSPQQVRPPLVAALLRDGHTRPLRAVR